MLTKLVPELESQLDFFDSARRYFAITRRYADQAFAGWNGDPKVSDEQFVIAAYQASQIYGISINPASWSITFGGEQLRNIQDREVRRTMEVVMTVDYWRSPSLLSLHLTGNRSAASFQSISRMTSGAFAATGMLKDDKARSSSSFRPDVR